MNSYDIGWLVGILEGEASFFLHKGIPVIQIRMTDKDTIERVAILLGTKCKEAHPPSWKKRGWSMQYEVRKYSAQYILKELLPYFSQRRQAKILSLIGTATGS